MTTDIRKRNNVRVMGDGAETVVLTHGFGSDQTSWRAQAAALASSYRVVLFDHVGGGHSDIRAYSAARYKSLRSYASDLLEVMDDLGLEKVLYAGHSMGGMIGVLAAQKAPQRFTRMAFVGASPRYLNDDGYVGGFGRADIEGLYDAMASNFQAWASGFAGAVMANPSRPEHASEFRQTLLALRPDIANSVARIIFESDYRADVKKHTVPTLLLQAHDDIAVPVDVARYLHANLADSRLSVIDAHGHLPHVSAPDVVTGELLRYFAS